MAKPGDLKTKLINIEKTAVGPEAYKAASEEIDKKCEEIANAVDAYIKAILAENLTINLPPLPFLMAGPPPGFIPIPTPPQPCSNTIT